MIEQKLIKEIKDLQARIAKIERIPDRNRQEQVDLQLVEDQYKTLSETITAGVVMTTHEGYITRANLAYQQMTGYTMNELKSLTYHMLTPKKWHKLEEDMVNKAAEEDYVNFEKEYVKKDGSVVPIYIIGWIIRDNRGKTLGTGSVVRIKDKE